MAKKNSITKREQITEMAVEVVKRVEQIQEKNKKRGLFRNTKVLLKHYRDLNDHVENAVWKTIIDPEEPIDLLSDLKEDIIINSIKRTASRTIIMIAHIETALQLLEKKAEPCKYQVIKRLYIDYDLVDLSPAEKYERIGQEIIASGSTVRRYEAEMIRQISLYLFGVGALELVK